MVYLTIFFLSVMVFLWGCGGKREEAAGKVNITYAFFATPAYLEIIQKQVKSFEEKYPEINVKLQQVSGNYNQKILTEIAGGLAPDVFWLAEYIPAFVEKGVLLNLNDFIANDTTFDKSDFYPQVFKMGQYKGNTYGIVSAWSGTILYYNKNFFDRAGIKYPTKDWTWDDLLNAARRLTKDTNGDGRTDQFGFITDNRIEMWLPFVWENGGKFLNKEGNKCLLNSPEAVAGLQFLADLRNKYKVIPSESQIAGQQSSSLFRTGRVAMQLSGRWMVQRYKDINRFDWDIAPIPKGKRRVTSLNGGALVIAAQSKHPQEAWELVKYLTGVKSQVLRARLDPSAVPSRQSVAISEIFMGQIPPQHNQVSLDTLRYGRAMPINSKWLEIVNIFGQEIDLLWLGLQPADEVAETITKRINNLLKE